MATVNCVKLGREAEALARPPLPGELGQRLFENVSAQAWSDWLRHQTMLINERRLSVRKPEDRAYLTEQVERYFFGDGADAVEGYVPEGDQ